MSVRVSSLVWDVQFPTVAAKLVALKLADCANDDGASIYPSRRTIERATGCATSTVKAVLARLQQCGLLEVEHRSLGGSRQATTIRRFNMPALTALASGALLLVDDGEIWRLLPKGRAGIATADGASGHTGPANGPASRRPEGGHSPARTGPANGPNPSLNRPNPHSSGGRAGSSAISEILEGVTAAKPARAVAVAELLGPVIRQREFRAPDPGFALGSIADQCAGMPAAILAAAAHSVLATRKATVKPSDIEEAVRAAAAGRQPDAHLPSEPTSDPSSPAAALTRRLVKLVGAHVVAAWFRGMQVDVADGVCTIAIADKFKSRRVQQHHDQDLRAAAEIEWPGVRVRYAAIREAA